MRSSKLVATVATVLLILVGSAAPASADTVRRNDRRGDAAPAFDIRWVRYSNADRAVVFTLKVKSLSRKTVAGGYFAEARGYEGYEFRTWVTRDGEARSALNYTQGNSATRVPCRSIDVNRSGSRNYVRVSFPRSCVSSVSGRLDMAASTGSVRNKWGGLDYTGTVTLAQG